MAVVVFDPDKFREYYPRFTPEIITDAQLQQCFNVACLILDNTDSSPIPYDPEKDIVSRETLLYLLVCHLATLALWPLGQTGPMSSASEGSVSTSFSVPGWSMDDAWFLQTPCGSTFLQAMAAYRVGPIYYPMTGTQHPWG